MVFKIDKFTGFEPEAFHTFFPLKMQSPMQVIQSLHRRLLL
jgi:hypothetical protein